MSKTTYDDVVEAMTAKPRINVQEIFERKSMARDIAVAARRERANPVGNDKTRGPQVHVITGGTLDANATGGGSKVEWAPPPGEKGQWVYEPTGENHWVSEKDSLQIQRV